MLNSPNLKKAAEENPCATTVDQLYEKFESLKMRISNSDNKRSNRSMDRKSQFQNRKDFKYKKMSNLNHYDIRLDFENPTFSGKDYVKEQKPSREWLLQLEKNFVKMYQKCVHDLSTQYNSKTSILMKRMEGTSKKLRDVHLHLRDKSAAENSPSKNDKSFTIKRSNTTSHTVSSKMSFENSDTPSFVEEIEKKHREQIEEIISTYEQKISLLKSDPSEKSQRVVKQKAVGSQSLKTLEEKLLEREQQVMDLQINNNKLRRMLDQSKSNFERNSELNKLLKEEVGNLYEVNKKLETWKKQAEIDKNNHESQVEKLKQQLRSKGSQINRQKQELAKLNSKVSKIVRKSHFKEENESGGCNLKIEEDRNCSTARVESILSRIETESSQDHSEGQSEREASIDEPIELQYLEGEPEIQRSKSLVFKGKGLFGGLGQRKGIPRGGNTNLGIHLNEKTAVEHEDLLPQLHLLEEENRLLKLKKDKFQQQLKKSEEDEQRFQQQGQILKNEIKRLNVYCKRLDECGVGLLKGEKIDGQVDGLEADSKLKEEFFKRKAGKGTRGLSWRK